MLFTPFRRRTRHIFVINYFIAMLIIHFNKHLITHKILRWNRCRSFTDNFALKYSETRKPIEKEK